MFNDHILLVGEVFLDGGRPILTSYVIRPRRIWDL